MSVKGIQNSDVFTPYSNWVISFYGRYFGIRKRRARFAWSVAFSLV